MEISSPNLYSPPRSNGLDVIIVSTKTPQQEDYWQKRLRQLCGIICKHNTFVIAVHDKLPENPNDLCHLFTYRKAQEKAKFMYQIDLFDLQKKGASIGLYHDGGAGKKIISYRSQ